MEYAIDEIISTLSHNIQTLGSRLMQSLSENPDEYKLKRLQALLRTVRTISYHLDTLKWVTQNLNAQDTTPRAKFFNFDPEDGEMHEVSRIDYAGTIDPTDFDNGIPV